MNNAIKIAIEYHESGKCNCDLRAGGYGLCMAGQYLEGLIDESELLEE